MNKFALISKFLTIGLEGLGLISPLAAEFGSGDHLGTINNSIQGAAALAAQATSDSTTQAEISAAAAVATGLIPVVSGTVNEIKALIASFEKNPATPAA